MLYPGFVRDRSPQCCLRGTPIQSLGHLERQGVGFLLAAGPLVSLASWGLLVPSVSTRSEEGVCGRSAAVFPRAAHTDVMAADSKEPSMDVMDRCEELCSECSCELLLGFSGEAARLTDGTGWHSPDAESHSSPYRN